MFSPYRLSFRVIGAAAPGVPPNESDEQFGSRSNRAVAARRPDIVTAQVPVPAQSPDHPANVAHPPGDARRTTLSPSSKSLSHALEVVLHMMPRGSLVTTPAPSPRSPTLSSSRVWYRCLIAATSPLLMRERCPMTFAN